MEKSKANPAVQEAVKKTYVGIMPHNGCPSLLGFIAELTLSTNITTAKCNKCKHPVQIDWREEMSNKYR